MNHLICITLLLVFSCKEKTKQAEISGRVVNLGSGQPIDSALVYVKDGVGSSGPINVGPTSTNREAMTYTNKNGEFHLRIEGEYTPYISANKKGYQNFSHSQQGSSIGYMPLHWGKNDNIQLELKGITDFCGVFIPNLNTDSLRMSFLGFANYKSGTFFPHAEGRNKEKYSGEYSIMGFKANNPINYCDGNYILDLIGDMYLRYKLDIKREGNWSAKIDSVYLKTGQVFNDTIYY